MCSNYLHSSFTWKKKKSWQWDTQRSILQLPSPPKSRWDSNPAETHEFLQSLCCLVFQIPAKYLQEHAAICMPAGKVQMLDCWSFSTWSLLLSLGILPLLQSIQHAQKWPFAVWPYLPIGWRCDLSTPDLEVVSKATCYTYDTGYQLSNLQMPFLRNTQEKHYIFPGAVFDFTMQNNPPAYCVQQCHNLKNKTKPKPGLHRMVARKASSLFNVKLGWGRGTFKRTCKKLIQHWTWKKLQSTLPSAQCCYTFIST